MIGPVRKLIGVGLVAGLIVGGSEARAEPIVVTMTNDANVLANTILAPGSGLVINSATYTGAATASGTFTGGTGIVGFESGIVLTTGNATFVEGPNTGTSAGTNNGAPGLPTLFPGLATFNGTLLEINFTPGPDAVNVAFSYVFGSEEYNEYVGTPFNDAFRFYVNGINYALIPGTDTPVSINTVNNGWAPAGQFASGSCTNCAYFRDNANLTAPPLNTQLDGLTVVLGFVAPVNPGVPNVLQLAIADVVDSSFDSAVFIAGGSLQQCGGRNQPPCGPSGSVPEPSTLLLFGTALAAALRSRWLPGRSN